MARKGDVDPAALRNLAKRIFPGSRVAVERTETGVSTQVYRVRHGNEVFYLRIAEERAASLAPEARAHMLLRERGVKAPEVVYFEPFDEALERSVMVTTEIRGEPLSLGGFDANTPAILREAGHDLARINHVPVEGFGWIRRDQEHGDSLEAEHATQRAFVQEHLDADLALLRANMLTTAEVATARATLLHWDAEHAHLAHGDLDLSHIYQHEGRYTGMIDFGEIRGAGRFYDLGHFKLHDVETWNQRVLPSLLEGYGEIWPLPADYEAQIHRWGLHIGIRALARSLTRSPSTYQQYLLVTVRDLIQRSEGEQDWT